jgi:hypothetical protein
MRPLPEPEAGEPIEHLRGFVNVESDDDFLLLVAWLVAALRPRGPYPIAIVGGEQGSAKSTCARVLCALVDPNVAPVRSAPKDERDLAVAAHNNRVLSFDNLSVLPGGYRTHCAGFRRAAASPPASCTATATRWCSSPPAR